MKNVEMLKVEIEKLGNVEEVIKVVTCGTVHGDKKSIPSLVSYINNRFGIKLAFEIYKENGETVARLYKMW